MHTEGKKVLSDICTRSVCADVRWSRARVSQQASKYQRKHRALLESLGRSVCRWLQDS
jgi:hypothetical protein